MATAFHLTVAKVGENLFDGEALSVTLPGAAGVFTVLAHHEALVSELKRGTITIRPFAGAPTTIAIEGGVAEVSNSQATVLL